jgi:hypothetical protein
MSDAASVVNKSHDFIILKLFRTRTLLTSSILHFCNLMSLVLKTYGVKKKKKKKITFYKKKSDNILSIY